MSVQITKEYQNRSGGLSEERANVREEEDGEVDCYADLNNIFIHSEIDT